jgi:serine/threonine protein kinase
MGDFPPQFNLVRPLIEGGQGQTFVVRRSGTSDSGEYVLKRLKNPKREDSFEREIRAYLTLDHPNVLRVLEHGRTPKGKPFMITEYCAEGSLEHGPRFDSPYSGLRFFHQIVLGVAHAHAHQPPICHLDLKPENILLKNGVPVVGDFGICFIEDDQVSLTSEGPRGSMYYCAPELRGPKIKKDAPLKAADVYSLGKVLYWLFTGEVYDGCEEDYGNDANRRLARLFPSHPQFAFIDELVSVTVQRNPAARDPSAIDLGHRVQGVTERIEAGGRPLDLRIPQRCLYCAAGYYRPAHDRPGLARHSVGPKVPDIAKRRSPYDPSLLVPRSPYNNMVGVAQPIIGLSSAGSAIPLLLICDYCGNVQYFRWDLTSDGHGENWLP